MTLFNNFKIKHKVLKRDNYLHCKTEKAKFAKNSLFNYKFILINVKCYFCMKHCKYVNITYTQKNEE